MAFTFTYLTGTEIAGYTSINTLIQSIDTQLTSRIPNKDTSGTGAFNAYVPVYDSTQASGFSQGLITSSNILNGTILDADINASAGIVDTKLATISTAGKVANSATTAASANGNSTIVARDGSGNFAADTITASLSGTATSATNIVGGSAASIPYQTGTSATGMLANGTVGQVLTSGGTTVAPSWQAASITEANIATNAVTEIKIATNAVTETKIATNAVTQAKMADSSVGTAEIIDANVTYSKLENTTKTYSPVSISSSTTLAVGTHDTTTTASIPLVVVTAAATISIPTGGVTGSVINIFSTTPGIVTIQPVSSSVTINGSTSNTYAIGDQFSMISLICYAANTWIITGDYA